jgi:hypothetical protein
VGVVPAGAEVVFFNLGIEVLAGEAEGIIERSAGFYRLAKRLITFMGQPLVPHSEYRQDNIKSFNTKRTQGIFSFQR